MTTTASYTTPQNRTPVGKKKLFQAGMTILVFEARLIVGQPKNHVFSQPPGTYSRISTAPPAPSCGYTHIKDHPLIAADRR